MIDLIKVFNAEMYVGNSKGVKAMFANGGDSDYITNLGFSQTITDELTEGQRMMTDNTAIPGGLFGKVRSERSVRQTMLE
jgi:hypothetical protein